jgi:DNA-binding NtrC family response regulator
MTMGDKIDVQDLPLYLHAPSAHSEHDPPPPLSVIGTLEEQERLLLIRALEAAAGNQTKAARILRIGRDSLRYKLKKHNLDTPDSDRATAAAG